MSKTNEGGFAPGSCVKGAVSVKETCAGPQLYVGSTQVRCWLGTDCNEEAYKLRDSIEAELTGSVPQQSPVLDCLGEQEALHLLTDQTISDTVNSMPGGVHGYMKTWGWYDFARAVEAELLSLLVTPSMLAWLRTYTWIQEDGSIDFSSPRCRPDNVPINTQELSMCNVRELEQHVDQLTESYTDMGKLLEEMLTLLREGKVRFVADPQGGIWTWPDRATAALQESDL